MTARRSITARQMGRKGGRARWQGVSPEERSRLVPHNGGGSGGRPRKYPVCPRYGAHRFTNDRCPCGYVRVTCAKTKNPKPAVQSSAPVLVAPKRPIPPPIVIH